MYKVKRFFLTFLMLACGLSAAPAWGGETIVYPGAALQAIYDGSDDGRESLAPSGSAAGKSNNLSDNEVTFEDGEGYSNVFGAVNYKDRAPVIGNRVTVNGGTLSRVYGGESGGGSVTGNSVTIKGGRISGFRGNSAYGGVSWESEAAGNSIIISGGSVAFDATGGMSLKGSVTGNSVIVSGGSAEGAIGGKSWEGDARGNSITITGGFVGGNTGSGVIGGRSGAGSATGNTAAIRGGEVGTNVYGGYSGKGNATGNTVIIGGGEFNAGNGIFGGMGDTEGGPGAGNFFSGNTLKLEGFAGSVGRVANFENYSFFVPVSAGNGGTILDVREPVNLGGTNIDITGVDEGANLTPGGTVILISSVTGAPKKINGSDFAEGKEFVTSGGTWKFSASGGELKATLVALPPVKIEVEVNEPPEQSVDDARSYVLEAPDADLTEAPDVVLVPAYLGGWRVSDMVVFNVDIEEAGNYSVTLVYSKPESGGDPADLIVTAGGEESFSAHLPPTRDDWSNYYEEYEFCTLPFPAGKTTLTLESAGAENSVYVMNLRSVILSPVAPSRETPAQAETPEKPGSAIPDEEPAHDIVLLLQNALDRKADFAVLYYDLTTGAWTTEGWFVLEPGAEKRIKAENARQSSGIYVHAESNRAELKDAKGGDNSATRWVRNEAFKFGFREKPEGTNLRIVNFFESKFSEEAKAFVYRVDSIPPAGNRP